MEIPEKKRMLVPLNEPRRPSAGARFIFAVLRPMLLLLGFVFGNLYKLGFGWLDRRVARQNHEHLVDDIYRHLFFLFSEYGARVLEEEKFDPPPPFDYAGVTLTIDTLRLRFVRGRGDLNVCVASAFAPQRWENLRLVADGFAQWEATRPVPYTYSLETLEGILRPRLVQLQAALSEEHFEETLSSAAATHNRAVDEYAAGLKQAGIVPKFL